MRRMRPRFRLSVPMTPAEVVARLEEQLNRPDCPCDGAVAANHQVVELRVLERDRHFWSPALSVTVAEDGDGRGSVVHGLVGPGPNVWTLFAMTYMGLLTLLMFVGIFGLVQWSLGLHAWGLYGVPALILALVLMYGLSRIGQRLAAPQTFVLRDFLESAIGAPGIERSVTGRNPDRESPAPRRGVEYDS